MTRRALLPVARRKAAGEPGVPDTRLAFCVFFLGVVGFAKAPALEARRAAMRRCFSSRCLRNRSSTMARREDDGPVDGVPRFILALVFTLGLPMRREDRMGVAAGEEEDDDDMEERDKDDLLRVAAAVVVVLPLLPPIPRTPTRVRDAAAPPSDRRAAPWLVRLRAGGRRSVMVAALRLEVACVPPRDGRRTAPPNDGRPLSEVRRDSDTRRLWRGLAFSVLLDVVPAAAVVVVPPLFSLLVWRA